MSIGSRVRSQGVIFGIGLAVWCTVLSEGARADAFSSYLLIGRFELPPASAVFDALPDGRLITVAGAQVLIESSPGSHDFDVVGMLPGADFPSFGPAFLAVSPDGARFALGNNGGSAFNDFRVGVFTVAGLAGDWFAAAHFDAAWIDDTLLAVSAGDFGSPSHVTVLDTSSPDPQNPANTLILDGVGGASGGVALDTAGNLYTGNGFQSDGPSGTGAVKAFSAVDWQAALSGGPVIDFESDGILMVDVLSASPLGFDVEGNLFLGGGDFSKTNEFDFVALVRASAIVAAQSGQGPADTGDPEQVRRLDPDAANDFNFFTTGYNSALKRLYVKDAGATTVHVYADVTGIPAVTTWGLVNMVALTAILGTLVLRRGSLGGSWA